MTWYRKFLLLFYFFKFFFSKVLVCVALIVTWYRKCTRAPTCQNSFQNRAIRVLVRYTHIFSKGLFIVSLHRKCARALTFQNCTIRVLVRCVLVVRGRGPRLFRIVRYRKQCLSLVHVRSIILKCQHVNHMFLCMEEGTDFSECGGLLSCVCVCVCM